MWHDLDEILMDVNARNGPQEGEARRREPREKAGDGSDQQQGLCKVWQCRKRGNCKGSRDSVR